MRSWLAVLLVVLSTCAVESTRPLSAPQKAKLDKALPGRWLQTDGGSKSLEVVIAAKSGGLMSVSLRGKEPATFEGHVSQVGTFRLLNLRLVEDGKAKGGYVFVRYAIAADGSLETWLLKDALFVAAIQAGKLKGGRTQYGGTLDDTPEHLERFILEQDPDALFEKLATFHKG